MKPQRPPSAPSASELVKEFEEGNALDIAARAQAHSVDALDTLVRLHTDLNINPAVQRGAAKDIIEIAHGRAAIADKAEADRSITVVINQLSSDEQLERVVAASLSTATRIVQEPIDVTPVDNNDDGQDTANDAS